MIFKLFFLSDIVSIDNYKFWPTKRKILIMPLILSTLNLGEINKCVKFNDIFLNLLKFIFLINKYFILSLKTFL